MQINKGDEIPENCLKSGIKHFVPMSYVRDTSLQLNFTLYIYVLILITAICVLC